MSSVAAAVGSNNQQSRAAVTLQMQQQVPPMLSCLLRPSNNSVARSDDRNVARMSIGMNMRLPSPVPDGPLTVLSKQHIQSQQQHCQHTVDIYNKELENVLLQAMPDHYDD